MKELFRSIIVLGLVIGITNNEQFDEEDAMESLLGLTVLDAPKEPIIKDKIIPNKTI